MAVKSSCMALNLRADVCLLFVRPVMHVLIIDILSYQHFIKIEYLIQCYSFSFIACITVDVLLGPFSLNLQLCCIVLALKIVVIFENTEAATVSANSSPFCRLSLCSFHV